MRVLTITALLAGVALTAGASAAADQPTDAPKPRRACFFADQINGWRQGKDATVAYLSVGANKVYRLDMMGRCNDLDTALTIGAETRGGGSSICDGQDVTLITRSPIGPFRCPVRAITLLTPEEAAALPRKERP